MSARVALAALLARLIALPCLAEFGAGIGRNDPCQRNSALLWDGVGAPPAKPVFDEQRAGIVNRRIDPRRNVRAHLLVWGIDLEFFAHALAQLDFGDCGHKGKYRAPEASGGINVLNLVVNADATDATGVQMSYYDRYIGL